MLRGLFICACSFCFPGLSVAAEPPYPTGAIPLGGHKDVAFSAAIDPGGLTGVTASFDKTIRVWDMAQGRLLRELGGPGGSQGIILGVDISADGQWLAAVGMDQTLRIWENPRLEPGALFPVPGGLAAAIQGEDPATRILANTKGELFRYKVAPPGGPPGTEKIEPFTEPSTIPNPLGKVTRFLRLTNNHFVLGTDRGELLLVDPKGKRLKSWLGQRGPISQMEIGWDGLVSIDAGARLKSWRVDATPPKPWPEIKPGMSARFLGLDPDKILILPKSGTPGLAQWRQLPDGRLLHELLGSEKVTQGVAGSGPEGPLAVLNQTDKEWAVWSGPQKDEKLRIHAPGKILAMTLLAGGRIAVSVDGLGIQKWQPPVGEPGKPFPIDKMIDQADVVSGGRRLLLGTTDNRLRSMEGVIPRVDRDVPKPPGYVSGTLSPDGMEFLAGLQDGTLTWNRRATGEQWQPGFKAHEGPIGGLLWLSTSMMLTWDRSGNVKYWRNPWDNGYKPGEKPEKFALPEIPESKGTPIHKIVEVEGGILVWREGATPKWVQLNEKKVRPIVAFPEGSIAQLVVFGRKVVAFSNAGKGFLLEDFKGEKPWIPLEGSQTDSIPVALSMSHPERAVLVSKKGNDSFADLYDLKDHSLVGRYGPWTDLKAAVVIPFANKILTLRPGTAQFHWANFEGRIPELGTVAAMAGGGNSLLAKTTDGRVLLADLAQTPPKISSFGVSGPGPLTISRNGTLGAWASDLRLNLKDFRTDLPVKSVDLKTSLQSLRFDPEDRKLVTVTTTDEAALLDSMTGSFLEGTVPGRKITDAIGCYSQQGWIVAFEQGIENHVLALNRHIPLPAGARSIGVTSTLGSWVVSSEGAVFQVSAQDGKPDKTVTTKTDYQAVEQSRVQQMFAVAAPMEVRFFALDGKELGSLIPPEPVRRISFHPGRAWLLVESDRLATLFDTTKVLTPQPGEDPIRLLGQVRLPEQRGPLAWAGQQDQSLLIPTEKGLQSWKVAQDNPVRSIPHPQGIDSVAFDPKGRFVATGCRDGKVRLWDIATGANKKEITLSAKPQPGPIPIYALAFRPDGGGVAVGGMDRAVRVYEPVSGNLIREFPGQPDFPKAGNPPNQGHEDAVFTLAWSPGGDLLASAGADRTIRVWNPGANRLEKALVDPMLKPLRVGSAAVAHPGWIHSLRFTGPGQLLSAGAGPKGSGSFRTWKVPEGSVENRYSIPQGPVQQVAIGTATGKALIATGHRIKSGEIEETISFLVPWPFPGNWVQSTRINSSQKD